MLEAPLNQLIEELATVVGIKPEYHDVWGIRHRVTLSTKEVILREMGFSVDDPETLRAELQTYRQRRVLRGIEPVYVFLEEELPREIEVYVKDGVTTLEVTITLESGETITQRWSVDALKEGQIQPPYRAILLPIPSLPLGYHHLQIGHDTGRSLRAYLIVTPPKAYLPEKRQTCICLNLYALVSERNQGIGDLTDLKDLMAWASKHLRVDMVGINPLHYISNRHPYGCSPYNPISRLYRNPIYIDLLKVQEVRDSERIGLILEGLTERIKQSRSSPLIDYEGVYHIKKMVLEVAFEEFYENHYLKDTQRAEDFRRYLEREGDLLRAFALFLCLDEDFRREGIHGWRHWPEAFQDPHSEETEAYARKNQYRILFHQYLQYLIQEQWNDLFSTGTGLYTDLALGTSSDGFETWYWRDLYAEGLRLGAPPDEFNPKGQDWGFPPPLPDKLRDSGYRPFVETLRRNMAEGGAIRIDHALGLYRLFLIPDGGAPSEGAYLRYPLEEMLRVICLESHRQKTVVVAEDLGTVPEGLREALGRYGILSFKVLYFEKDSSGEFIHPSAYPELTAVSVTTHDLPTLRGYLSFRDIEVKEKLDLYPDPDLRDRDRTQRIADIERLIRILQEEDLLRGWPRLPERQALEETIRAVYRLLRKAPAIFLIVNLDDLLLILDQQNLPGTVDEYPNWRQRLPYDIEEIKRKLTLIWPYEEDQF